MTGPEGMVTAPFEHIGLLYHTPGEYADGCAGFLRRALDHGQPALVVVPGGKEELVRARLGPDAARVRFADMAVAGRNPGRIIPHVLLGFATDNPAQRVWIIGEPIWAGRSAIEYPACMAHEALINVAFAGRRASILCPYDAAALTAEVIEDAHRTHPHMADATNVWASALYADPAKAAARFNLPLPPPPPSAHVQDFTTAGELNRIRALTASRARAAGLDRPRSERVVFAVNEVATNAFEHTPGGCTLSLWAEGTAFVCQIDDGGHFGRPLAGHVPPGSPTGRGHGLLLVNDLADLVRRHDHARGTTTRLYFRR